MQGACMVAVSGLKALYARSTVACGLVPVGSPSAGRGRECAQGSAAYGLVQVQNCICSWRCEAPAALMRAWNPSCAVTLRGICDVTGEQP